MIAGRSEVRELEQQRRVVCFEGMVQGVGFRYTAVRLAGGYDVTGYVRNLPDGRVEICVEGAAGEVEAFISAVRQSMGRRIRRVTQQTSAAGGEFDGFGVRY